MIVFFISNQYLVSFLRESKTKKTLFCNITNTVKCLCNIYVDMSILTCFLLYKGLAVSWDIDRERTFKTLEDVYLLTETTDFVQISYAYVNFDGQYDFASFKFVSLFVCLLLTKSGSSHISSTDGPILLIFGIPM